MPEAQQKQEKKHRSFFKEWVEPFLIAAVVALFIRQFAAEAFKIPSGSMIPTLEIGDHLLVNKFMYAPTASSVERALLPIGRIRRGDVLVFKYPVEPDRDYIKRVIGLPGETLQLKEKKIYIDGKPLDEPYVHFLEEPRGNSDLSEVTSSDVRENYGPVTVPPNQYFMMGDNRDNSADSRYWGFMPRDYVKGKALLIYWAYESEREDYEDESATATVKGLASVFMHFFTKTRWDRLGHFIH